MLAVFFTIWNISELSSRLTKAVNHSVGALDFLSFFFSYTRFITINLLYILFYPFVCLLALGSWLENMQFPLQPPVQFPPLPPLLCHSRVSPCLCCWFLPLPFHRDDKIQISKGPFSGLILYLPLHYWTMLTSSLKLFPCYFSVCLLPISDCFSTDICWAHILWVTYFVDVGYITENNADKSLLWWCLHFC